MPINNIIVMLSFENIIVILPFQNVIDAYKKYHCYAAFRKYNFATYQKYHFYAAFRKYNFAAFQKAKLPFLSSLSGLTSSQVDDQSVGVEGNSTGGTVTPCLKKMFCFTTFVLVIIP